MVDSDGTGGRHIHGHDIHRECGVASTFYVEPLRQKMAKPAILFGTNGQRSGNRIPPAAGFHLNRNQCAAGFFAAYQVNFPASASPILGQHVVAVLPHICGGHVFSPFSYLPSGGGRRKWGELVASNGGMQSFTLVHAPSVTRILPMVARAVHGWG